MIRFRYLRPQTIEEAWKLKNEIADSSFIAGGTDILVKIKNNEVRPSALISLRLLQELKKIGLQNGARIGSLVTITSLLANEPLHEKYPLLKEAAKNMACVQIRNVATVGGNLCNASPSADIALALLTLEATLRLSSPQGDRLVPVDEFFKGEGKICLSQNEILTEIILGPPPLRFRVAFLKKGRVKMDLAVVSLACLFEIEGKKCHKARISAGSAAPRPLRLRMVEELLEGEVITKRLISEAQKIAQKNIQPISDIRGSEEYRRELISVFLKRALEQLFD